MATFGKIFNEEIIQVGDKTRIDVSKSFADPNTSITQYEIEVEAAAGFIDVTSNKYLDWSYATDGLKVVTLRINGTDTFTANITSITAANDSLFSSDSDLISSEDEVMSYIRKGRNSFLDKHREAQRLVISELDRLGITKSDGTRLVPSDIFNLEEVKSWSKFLTLAIIYEGLVNDLDDVFSQKSIKYRKMALNERTRSTLRLDDNQDGNVDQTINMIIGSISRK